MTRRVRIFLASSAELDEDKILIENFFGRKNKDWQDKRVFLELNTWRDFLSSVAMERTQEQYNRYIRTADIVILLFHTRVGRFTREEFEQAHRAFLDSGKRRRPRIYTFFKSVAQEPFEISEFRRYLGTLGNIRNREVDPSQDSGHFYDTYVDMDDLLVKIGRQLDLLEREHEIIVPERIDTGRFVKYGLFGFLLPLLVFAGAVGTWYYRQPGTLLVVVREPRGIPGMPYARGGVTLTYDGTTDSSEIGSEALFRNIPSTSKHAPARLRFTADGFEPIDTTVIPSGAVELAVRRDSSLARLHGSISDEGSSEPLSGVVVRMNGLSTTTDSVGSFRLVIPLERQAMEQRISVRKEGYRARDVTVAVTRAPQKLLLTREPQP